MSTSSNLNKISSALTSSQQRLGTGFRINGAADDAAGLQVATRLDAQSRGMEVAMRNVADASSMLQTGDGALDEVTNILQRMKDLATQSASGTNGTDDRAAMQAEYDELGKELHNILENTKFNGEQLFSTAGKFSAAVAFQTGATGAEQLTFDGSAQLTALRRDLAAASDKVTSGATLAAAAAGALAAAQTAHNAAGDDISGATDANTAIGTLTTALGAVSAMRGKLGANINRLGHIANNLGNVKDNTDVARGRIMDTDFAKETSKATKNQMLTQSSIAMLKQTSQMPGMIMSLLG